jgi:hypothetical protein
MGADQRDRGGMARPNPYATGIRPLIDIGRALDLLAEAVAHRGEYFAFPPIWIRDHRCLYANRGGPCCLVGHALSLAGVGDDDLVTLGDRGVRELYAEGRLPVRLTLGALAVFDAAQRSQDRGYAWGDALDYASGVAVRLLDLLPDSAFSAVHALEDEQASG